MEIEIVQIGNANDLGNCPACDEEISILAVNCPHCGRPKPFVYFNKRIEKSECGRCHGKKSFSTQINSQTRHHKSCPICNGTGEVESVFLECRANNFLEIPDIIGFSMR